MENLNGGSAEYLKISVSDPEKVHESINQFITYHVNTDTNKADFAFGQRSVVRRYNDFRWVHSQLVENYPGCIVPPLPEKLVVGRFSPEFVETRRRNLEKFLHRVSEHPDLGNAEAFRIFLQAEDAVLHQEKEKIKPSLSASPHGILGMMNKSFNKAVTTVDTISHPDDARVEEIITYINRVDIQFNKVAKESKALVTKNRDLHQHLFEFGLSLNLLGQDEEGSVSDGCKALGDTSDRLSYHTAQFAEKIALYFDDPISEYCRIIAAVKLAYAKRKEALDNYSFAKTDYENKKIKHSGYVAQQDESKVKKAEEKMHDANQVLDESKKVFEIINTRFLEEFARFQREKAEDMKQTMVTFIKLQMDFHKQMHDQLNELLPKIDPIVEPEGESYSLNSKDFYTKSDTFASVNPLAGQKNDSGIHEKPVSSLEAMNGNANGNNPFNSDGADEVLVDDDDHEVGI